MRIVTDPKEGMFPLTKEISFRCDCPDWAGMCKHVAAVLYGVGARLDVGPELLFLLRGVDHEELVAVDAEAVVSDATSSGKNKRLAADKLSDVFGIDLDPGDHPGPTAQAPPAKSKRPTTRRRVTATGTKKNNADSKTSSREKSPHTAKTSAGRKPVKKNERR